MVADKRLSDAIGLVRKIAEKTHQLLSKKPFMALFTHMVTLLVHGGQIFPPAAIDYIKALKTILSYPPHLECLDSMNWRIVVGVCWASILGDPVRLSENDKEDELEDESDMDMDRKPDMTQSHSAHARQKTLSNINGEIAGLLPILFSAPAAPLLSPLPDKDMIYIPESSTGTNMLLKIHRFFQQYPNDNNAHLPVLRTLNLILAEMELNARNETISASLKLLPQIGNLWSTRKKDTREQVVIALRTMLPFVTHKVAGEYDKTGLVRETLAKIMDHLPKEGQLRWGVEPLDLSVIRLKARSRKGKEKETHHPFETSAMKVSFPRYHRMPNSSTGWL
jgi:ataxia telangiectasia mutated family protein